MSGHEQVIDQMAHLYESVQQKTAEWRQARYPSDQYPAIAEILEYARLSDGDTLRFLRQPQLRALETYWYLRLVEGTPHIFDLYKKLFTTTTQLLSALGVSDEAFKQADFSLDTFWDKVNTDDGFVRQHHLESLRETRELAYPSYILALAMGAGKTILIGTIIATEFAMALEYPDGPFIKNALVFAPGKTIVESLRELADIPFDRVLPPRLHKPFSASYKLTFTRDGEKDLPIIRSSYFNVVVTNTEKIRIQKPTVRANGSWTQLELLEREKRETEIANLRLQAIASLPRLGVFSDEAHHTYGQAMEADLKKVRKTVNYLHEQTPLVCVVNTTGTPYYQRQPLKDVAVWYGLSQGIRENILKEVSGSIYAYDFDNQHTEEFVAEVLRDFFHNYGNVRLPSGALAKLAVYFPQNEDLMALLPTVERTIVEVGQSPTVVLRNTSESPKAEVDAFNRLNDPASPYRVMLLVNKGTEGWNCPSLFACALARRLRTSNNFVLQASTRCLRQVPGNTHQARIYLSKDNRGILDRQLQETFGESIADLNAASQQTRTTRLVLRKINLPPLVIKRLVRRVVPKETTSGHDLNLAVPTETRGDRSVKQRYAIAEQTDKRSVLRQVDEETIAVESDQVGVYAAAISLAATYRLDTWQAYSELQRIYRRARLIPQNHLRELGRQIEEQIRAYEVREEVVEVALALVRPEGFKAVEEGGAVVYTAEIAYPIDREHLLLSWEKWKASKNSRDFGFHYTPYNFDSAPEMDYFSQILTHLNTVPDEVEDIYFTGGLTDPGKTDFCVEYKGEDGKWHHYTPDFVIRKRDGRCLIVEIKAERERHHPDDGEVGNKALALRRWEDLNPDRLKYEMIFALSDAIAFNQLNATKAWIREG